MGSGSQLVTVARLVNKQQISNSDSLSIICFLIARCYFYDMISVCAANIGKLFVWVLGHSCYVIAGVSLNYFCLAKFEFISELSFSCCFSDAPLDMKIKSNMIADLFSLVGQYTFYS